MKKSIIALVILVIGITTYYIQKDNQSRMMPAPTDGTIVRMDMEDGDNKTKRNAWFDLMHKTADDQDWRMIEQDNMMAKYEDKLRRKSQISSRNGIEPVADGKLEGTWSERGASNVAGNIRIAQYDATTQTLYVISDGGTLWKGGLEGFSWEVINQEIQFSKDLLEIAHLDDGTERIISSINNKPYYSDDGGIEWNTNATFTNSGGSRLYDVVTYQDTESGIDQIMFLHRTGNGKAINVRSGSIEEVDFQSLRSFGTNDPRNIAMAKVGNGDDIYLLEQKSATTSKLHKFDFETGNFETAVNDSPISSGNGTLNIDAVIVDDTLHLYSFNDESQLYRSKDEGQSWELLSTLTIDPWNVGLYISPSNPTQMMAGAVNAIRSNNGGKNWQTINEWHEYYGQEDTKLHADIMYFEEFTDENGETFILNCNHGGVYITRDQGKNHQNISLFGLATAQYYDVRTLPSDPEWVFAGSQDQGFQKGILDDDDQIADFSQVISGDYGHIEFTNNGTNLWTVYPGGSATFWENPTTLGPTAGYEVQSDNETVWIPPMMADPDATKDIMYMAGGNAEGGSGSYLVQMKYEFGSIVAQNMPFNFINWGTISAMATSPLNEDIWYVATTDGRFFTSTDRGFNFEIQPIFGPGAHYLYGAGILPSANHEGTVYFCGSGYNNAAVHKSEDYGATFSPMSEGLPPTLVYNIAANEDESLLYAATEAGPYVYIVADEQWYDLSGAHTPTQTYWSVEYLKDQDIARFGTYGRGIWDFKIENDFVNTKDIVVDNKSMAISPNPANEYINIKIENAKSQQYTARIIDIAGRVIDQRKVDFGGSDTQLDVTQLKAGNYVLQLISIEQQYVQKFIKI